MKLKNKLSYLIPTGIALFSILVVMPHTALAAYGTQTKTTNCVANQALPDSDCTPGAMLTTNTNTICKPGYTKTVRDVSLSVRKQVFLEYGIPYSKHANYEVDHLISLELGGSNDISNLFPESYSLSNGAKTKDKFENYLHTQVCKSKMTIEEAQAEISSDWLSYYQASKGLKTMQPAVNQEVKAVAVPVVPTPPAPAIPTVSIPSASPAPSYTNQASEPISAPTGASAQCNDGSYSYSASHRGTCSHHGGVRVWY